MVASIEGLVSVVIPCHNVEATLGLQLEALARQEDPGGFEVIVVANAVTDDTVAVADSWRDRLPSLKVVVANERASVSYARNRGIAAAAGDKLLFCDGDDCVSPHFVRLGRQSLEQIPIFSASAVPVTEAVLEAGWRHAVAQLSSDGAYQTPGKFDQNPDWPVLMGAGFGITRELALELQGFDPALDPGAEDNDLALRAQAAGQFPLLSKCCQVAYRVPSPGQRSWRLYRLRAKSTALARTFAGRWEVSPLLGLVRTLAAGGKLVLLRRWGRWPSWKERLAIAVGLVEGYLRYQLGGRLPPRRLGEGLADDVPDEPGKQLG